MEPTLPRNITELRRAGALSVVLRELWAEPTQELDPDARVDSPAWLDWYRSTNELLARWAAQCVAETPCTRLAAVVHLQLLAMRKEAAAATLIEAGWLSREDEARYRLNRERVRLARELREDLLGGAQLLCEIAFFLYRVLCVAEGEAALEASRQLVRLIPPADLADLDLALLEASWDLARARFSRRSGSSGNTGRDSVARFLALRTDALRASYDDGAGGPTGGVDLALAMNLEVRAALAWQQGDIHDARRLIYEAMSLLSTQRDGDEIRLAVALKTAATIDAVYSDAGFKLAMRWASKAATLFAKYRHPFEWRAHHQHAQCYLKANRMDAAQQTLARVQESIERSVPGSDDVERAYALAEIALSMAWTKQRVVLGPGMARGLRRVPADDRIRQDELLQWKEHASTIARPERSIPQRLVSEGLFQLGLATLCEGSTQAGQLLLEEALKAAEGNGRAATEVACCLALAECHAEREGASSSSASYYWRRGQQQLATVRSSFLAHWALRLSAEFRWQVAFFHLDRTWKVVEAEVQKAFLQYHLKRADYDVGGAQRSSGLSKSHFYDLCKKLGISLQPERGPRARTPAKQKRAPSKPKAARKARKAARKRV